MRILVTGGAGFIGSALCRHLVAEAGHTVINVDKLTYAASLDSLADLSKHPQYRFIRADIADRTALHEAFRAYRPEAVMHLAAESHVDRSIDRPAEFIHTNIVGTYQLLDVALAYWRELSASDRTSFRFHHVSTDEVYGSLGPTGLFTETTPYAPNSPYAASKASSDHLVRAWHHTFGLPIVISNCSNNYGPWQFPEKFIPLMILNALDGRALPVYGRGENVRDWLHVDDHARALLRVLEAGQVGEQYNIGGHNEHRNIDVVQMLCTVLDELQPAANGETHERLVTFVEDRPGHDLRYAIDATKMQQSLDWAPQESFETGLRSTVQWYLGHQDWCREIQVRGFDRPRMGQAR